MNWQRGLLRLWAVGSIVWIGVVFAANDSIQTVIDPISVYQNSAKLTGARAAGYSDDEIIAFLRKREIIGAGKLALLPPLAVLMAIGAGWWIARGFRQAENQR